MVKKNKESPDEVSAVEEQSELNLSVWSVVNFEKTAAKNLTYAEAVEKLKELKSEKVSGLCIVTDEAAARISKKKKKK